VLVSLANGLSLRADNPVLSIYADASQIQICSRGGNSAAVGGELPDTQPIKSQP